MSGGTDFSHLLEEAQQMLSSVGEVLASTMQQGVEVVKNYEELASDKVSTIVKEKKKELADLSTYGENAKSCVERMQGEFQRVEEKLRKELAACYTKHYDSLEKIFAEKATVHEEAKQIKNQLEQEMVKCMSAANKTDCFVGVLDGLKKRVKTLSSRVGEMMKKEAQARVKASKAVFDCDKKAMDDAHKKCDGIMNELKKCTAKQG